MVDLPPEQSTPRRPFPAIHSVLAPDALLAEVARHYPTARPEYCVLHRSYANDVYRVMTAGEPYILKVYRAGWRTAAEVAYEVDLLAHLAAKGVPVAAAVRRRDGRLFGSLHALEGTRQYALFAEAPGTTPTPPFTEHLYHRFGRATAMMHVASDDFASAHRRAPLDLAHFLDRPLAALRPRLEARPDDWHFLVALAEKVRRRVATLAPELDWGPCHGDLSLDNLHIAEDGKIILYDFDSGGPGWRASDPYGVYRYAREGELPLWEPFLRGYRELRTFGAAELSAVPYFAAAYAIESLGHQAANWVAWGGQWLLSSANLDERLASLRGWETNELRD